MNTNAAVSVLLLPMCCFVELLQEASLLLFSLIEPSGIPKYVRWSQLSQKFSPTSSDMSDMWFTDSVVPYFEFFWTRPKS